MKKLFLVTLVFLSSTSICNEKNFPSYAELTPEEIKIFYKIDKVEFEGHSYILFRCNSILSESFVHDPYCPCMNKGK